MGDGVLVRTYDDVLRLGQDARDVYLLYRADTRWEGVEPPRPTYWMHQLHGVTGPTLNGHTLADEVRRLLGNG
jgi:hypothetical protein